jgi:hypothetical protein
MIKILYLKAFEKKCVLVKKINGQIYRILFYKIFLGQKEKNG